MGPSDRVRRSDRGYLDRAAEDAGVAGLVPREARRHGVESDDMLHAPGNTFLVAEDMTMGIGADRAGRFLEVGVVESRDEPGLVVAHAMAARPKFLGR